MRSQRARTIKVEGRTLGQTIRWQPKEGKTFFKWPTFTPPTQTTEWTSLHHKMDVQVTWRHPHFESWWHASDTIHTNHVCIPMHSHFCTFIYPANEPPNLHTPKHHATSDKPSCTLNLPPPSTSASQPSLHHTVNKNIQQPNGVSSHQDIEQRPNKHKLSHAKLVTLHPKKHDISSGYIYLARKLCSKKASKFTRTSHHGQKAYAQSHRRLSPTQKRRPNTFTANAQEKKAEEASSKYDIYK